MKKQILRVGFDLDGVLLYNPARIARPVIVFFKKIFLPKEQNKFHLPKTKLQKFLWWFLHKSSFMTAPGLDDIKRLINGRRIEAYIVSARYESLRADFYTWVKKIEADKYFVGIHYNNNDEQPHLFKEKIIKKLKLDIFVEDNWDIVKHLNQQFTTNNHQSKIFWIYNLLDKNIKYKYKFRSLKKAISQINKLLYS